MKISLSWLKEHLDTDAEPKAIAETLTRIGLEVEAIEDKASALAVFTVARVISAEPHPNADKLRVCMVDTGKETVQVVCGAPNARAGLKAVFAPPGTYVPGSKMTLAIAKIRGVESHGMLCSERELELSEEHAGIIELGSDASVGTAAAAALGLGDAVIDVALTPNRGDCTSVYGIARDLAAAGIGRLKDGAVAKVPGRFASPIKTGLEFAWANEIACPMFAGRLIKGVKSGPSPEWLQTRLKAVGLRPISALVDVTNFLSHDRGRPLHAFDATKLQGDLKARMARPGETLRALDGKTYDLDGDMIVIADDITARGIAGVMGGEDSAVGDATTDVFLESALFDPIRIARAGRTLGILSDARYRFERGVDPEFVLPGLELATKLILEFCGGEASEIVTAGKPPAWRREVAFSGRDVERLAGLSLETSEIIRILNNLGFAVEKAEPLRVMPPSWRADVHGAADCVEEVVRIHGLDKVPAVAMKRVHAVARPVLTQAQKRIATIRRALATRGFDETVHFSFIRRKSAALFGGGDESRQLENPISADLDAMRPSLLPSLLEAAARNQARGVSHLMFFEIGAQFASGNPGAQSTVAAAIRAGEPPRHWNKGRIGPDIFAAKADALAGLEAAWGQKINAQIQAGAPSWYHPGRSGTIALGQKPLVYFGEFHPGIIAAFDLKGPAAGFEIFLDAIPETKARKTKAKGKLAASDLMAVERDFAFIVDNAVEAGEIVKAARSAERALIERVDVFDVYQGKGVPDGKKSLAIAVRLQPADRTLTDAEIETIAQKIVNAVTKATGGSLRS